MENDQKNMLKSVKLQVLIMVLGSVQLHTAMLDDSSPIKFPQKPSARSDIPKYCEDVGRFLRTTQGGQAFLKERYLGDVPEIAYMSSHDIRSEYEGWRRNRMRKTSASLEETIRQREAEISEKDQAHAEALRAAELAIEEARLEAQKALAGVVTVARQEERDASASTIAELRGHHASVLQKKQSEFEIALTQAEEKFEAEKEVMQSSRALEIAESDRQHTEELQAAREDADRTLAELRKHHASVLQEKQAEFETALTEVERRFKTEKEALRDARLESDRVLDELRRQHTEELQAAREDADRTLAELRRRHEAEKREKDKDHAGVLQASEVASTRVLDDLRRQHANALQATREEATGAVAAVRREEQDASTRMLEDLRRQLKEEARARGQVHDDAMRDARTASDRVLDDLRRQHADELKSLQSTLAGSVAARREEQGKTEVMLAEADQRRELQTEEVISRSELEILASKTLASFVEQPQQRTLTLEETFAQAYKDGKYDPFFEILKAQARDKFTALMLRFSEGQFLHGEAIVGVSGKPKDRSREAFIRFGLSVIESLTMQSALAGEHFKAVIVPRDDKEEERTRFTKALRGFIVNTLGYNINSLRTDSDDFFCDETVKYDCGVEDELKYFKAILSAGLR